jgi:hypothetical protein
MKFKTHKVIMLSTENESNVFEQDGKLKFYQQKIKRTSNEKAVALYILSDDKIEEGDWYTIKFLKESNVEYEVVKAAKNSDIRNLMKHLTNKIIATNNPECQLPSPSEDFILEFISEYNKHTPITEVMVEYEMGMSSGWQPSYNNPDNSGLDEAAEPIEILKVDKNNTVTVKKVKDTFTIEEVKEIAYKASIDCYWRRRVF